MLTKKNIALCIVFSVITCGLYSLYWLYCLAEDVNWLTGREGAMSGGMVLLLTIVTCGIYGIYWLIRLADDLNIASGRTNDPSGGMVALLTFVTCGIYGIYWAYKAGEKVAYIKNRNTGEVDTSCATLYLIISLIGGSIVVWALIQNELNKVATLR